MKLHLEDEIGAQRPPVNPKYEKYNRSSKGMARDRAYERRHPERAQRARTGFIARDAYARDDASDRTAST